MNIEELSSEYKLKNINLDIMFAAVPKKLIADTSKKINKRKTKNLFYSIFGVLLKESGQYIVFSNVFKATKTKFEDNFFKSLSVDTAIYEEKHDVLTHIYEFIDDFEGHERIINEDLANLGALPAKDALEYLLLWNQSLLDYFNKYIEDQKS